MEEHDGTEGRKEIESHWWIRYRGGSAAKMNDGGKDFVGESSSKADMMWPAGTGRSEKVMLNK